MTAHSKRIEVEATLRLALEALEKHGDAYLGHLAEYQFAITKVKEALSAERVAQPEQPKQNTVEAVKVVLKGIDKTEIESPDGWWETSTGAEFGAKKLKYVVGLLAQPAVAEQHKQSTTCGEPVAEGWCDGCNPDNCQGCGPAAKPKHEPIFWYRPVGEDGGYEGPIHNGAIEKVRKLSGVWKPLYTTPPYVPTERQRTWVGLTDEEREDIATEYGLEWIAYRSAFKEVEAKLKAKNERKEKNT